MMTRRFVTAAAAALCLAACAPSGAPDYVLYHLNPPAQPTAQAGAKPAPVSLSIDIPVTGSGLDTHRIALRKGSTEMDFYAGARWPDTVPSMLKSLLVETFEQSGMVQSVSDHAAGIAADYMLLVEIRDFEAIYRDGAQQTPPGVKVALSAKLLRMPGRELIATQRVQQEEAAQSASLAAVIGAFDRANQRALQQLVTNLAAALAPAQPPTE